MSSGEDVFHPMGEQWESEMEAMLDDTEYDTELGMDIAEDAQRLTKGEITEQEFYDKYHDAIVAEFGVDDRPMAESFEPPEDADRGLVDSLKRLQEGDGDVDRREVMKKMGAGAAFLGLGGMATAENANRGPAALDNPNDGDDDGPRWGMVIDLERCDACLSCVVGCIDENGTSTGANWMYVLAYEDENTEQENYLVRPCQHCSNAPCAKVCPVSARHHREDDNLVLTNYETCIGCRYCQVACPYGVNYFQWGDPDIPMDDLDQTDQSGSELRDMDLEDRHETLVDAHDHVYDDRGEWVDSRPPKGVMGKCTFCPSRQDGHMGEEARGTTACMDYCDDSGSYAIHFGDLNDPESRPRRALRQRAEMASDREVNVDDPEYDEDWEESQTADGNLSAFKLLEDFGTEPNIIYLGNEPGPEAEQMEDRLTYDGLSNQWGHDVEDARKDRTDEFTVGF